MCNTFSGFFYIFNQQQALTQGLCSKHLNLSRHYSYINCFITLCGSYVISPIYFTVWKADDREVK